MGKDSEIEWCHHTFNPWWGCEKVSAGCLHCYAETLSHRWGFDIWGPAKHTARRTFGDKHWQEPIKWNREVEIQNYGSLIAPQRHRVFSGSMCDVFENHPMLPAEREKLFGLISATPYLDWLLLTKRPENILQMIPEEWKDSPLHNVWFGTSVEDQGQADKRIPELLKVPATVRFLSCEPLIEEVNLHEHFGPSLYYYEDEDGGYSKDWKYESDIDWVIIGGESGHGKRPFNTNWARSIHGQCEMAGVAFFMKQVDKIQSIPDDLMIRQFPAAA